MHPYVFLFLDSIKAVIAFTPNVDMAYIVMQAFGNYNNALMLALAISGSLIGSLINYGLGCFIRWVKNKFVKFADTEKLVNLSKVAEKYLVYLCIFSFLPLWGVVLTVAAGFLQVRLLKFLVVILASKVLYYSLII